MTSLYRYKPQSEFYTEEGCYIVELRDGPHDPQCSIARARVPVGKTTQRHMLRGIVERYVILEGTGIVEIGDQPATAVTPFDVVTIPADVTQRITNTGVTDLVFLCVCTPPFRPDHYMETEKDR